MPLYSRRAREGPSEVKFYPVSAQKFSHLCLQIKGARSQETPLGSQSASVSPPECLGECPWVAGLGNVRPDQ